MLDHSTGPWTVPTCSTGPLHLLPFYNRYQTYHESDYIPVHLALYATTTCIRLNYANAYCDSLHHTYQDIALQFLHRVETTSDLELQLAWPNPHTHGYWQTLLSLNRSYDGVLVDYGANGDYVYLMFRENISWTMAWYQMHPHHPVFVGLPCPPLQACVRISELASPNTPNLPVDNERSNGTLNEVADKEGKEESTDASEGENESSGESAEDDNCGE